MSSPRVIYILRWTAGILATASMLYAEIVQPGHPIMKGLEPFTTWDETYVHNKQNPVDRTVLMERVDAQGREPYTWVRKQGKGRVFYTAYGHDERTWKNPGFQKLIANAVEWGKPLPVSSGVDASPIAMTGIAHDEGTMSYDKNSLTVRAGETVKIVFVNPDVAPHNFLLCEPGSLKAIGAAADKMVRMGTGEDDNYVPKMKEVLFIAPVLEPKKTTTFEFKAPSVPGVYPYICTFPGHWKTMNGALTVLPPL